MCDPYITQDGYDSGLVLMCETHGTREPVMKDGRQAYTINLITFARLHRAHQYGPL